LRGLVGDPLLVGGLGPGAPRPLNPALLRSDPPWACYGRPVDTRPVRRSTACDPA